MKARVHYVDGRNGPSTFDRVDIVGLEAREMKSIIDSLRRDDKGAFADRIEAAITEAM